jgi:hypothetical protein
MKQKIMKKKIIKSNKVINSVLGSLLCGSFLETTAQIRSSLRSNAKKFSKSGDDETSEELFEIFRMSTMEIKQMTLYLKRLIYSKQKQEKKSRKKQKRKAEQVDQWRELIYRYYIQENNEKAK